MALVYKGMLALLIGAGVIWVYWMTFVFLRRTKTEKKKEE